MRNPKVLNGALWTASGLLVLAIAGYAFQFLLFQPPSDLLDGVDRPVPLPAAGAAGAPPKDFAPLREGPNPLRERRPDKGPAAAAGRLSAAKLLGTEAKPEPAVAYLWIPSRNLNVNAYAGEPVLDRMNEVEVPELAGWVLVRVTSATAVFRGPGGEETLTVEAPPVTAGPAGAPGPLAPGAGDAWEKGKFSTKQTRTTDSMEVWEVDAKEAAWASANFESALANVQLSVYPGGGLKIDALPDGSVAFERGFRTGDVLKAVNGQGLDSVQKMSEIFKAMGSNQRTVTIQVDRSGRPYTLQFQVARTPGAKN